jgi:RNA polymerase sigma factor FliA
MRMHSPYPEEQLISESYRTDEGRTSLVRNHIGLVRYVARKFRFQHARSEQVLEEMDLVQFGLIGLLDAVERFEPEKGVKFETYAVTRIKGTILDELRRLDWVPRSVRKRKQAGERLVEEMEHEANRASTAQEIATKLSMTLDEYEGLINDARGFTLEGRLSFDEENKLLESIEADRFSDPFEIMNAEERRACLIEAVESLPKRERLIMTLYYYESMTFREIGLILKISESRVCQIHKSVLNNLRPKLSSFETVP